MNFSVWYRRWTVAGPVSMDEWLAYGLLLPFGFLYGLVGRLRTQLYRWRVLASHQVEVPVVSVGNLVAGGTGKTPLVDCLLQWAASRQMRVAVISRGYGGKRQERVLTVSEGQGPRVSVLEAGDEPFLLASRHPEAIVVVGSDRVGCARRAIDDHGAELLILDDGYQHLRLHRDLNLLLLDARAPFGNGRVLPAGYLREPAAALGRATMLVMTHCDDGRQLAPPFSGPVATTDHVLSRQLHSIDGQTIALDQLQGRAAAFCGIADPDGFFTQLRQLGIELTATLGLADHRDYSPAVIEQLNRLGGDADFFLTTEKDGVKLKGLQLTKTCYQVPLQVEFTSGRHELDTLLEAMIDKDKQAMPLSKDLLEILACPQCKGEIHCNDDETAIRCEHCRLSFPVRDEIPVMLIDEAESF